MPHSHSESALRKRANRLGYRIVKSRQQEHCNNYGQFLIVDAYNSFAVGGYDYSASLDEVADFLDDMTDQGEETA